MDVVRCVSAGGQPLESQEGGARELTTPEVEEDTGLTSGQASVPLSSSSSSRHASEPLSSSSSSFLSSSSSSASEEEEEENQHVDDSARHSPPRLEPLASPGRKRKSLDDRSLTESGPSSTTGKRRKKASKSPPFTVDHTDGNHDRAGGVGAQPNGEAKKRSKKGRGKKQKNRHLRRNIKAVLKEDLLEKTTKEAQAEEAERLKRLQEQQKKQRLEQEYLAQIQLRQQMRMLEATKSQGLVASQSFPSPQVVNLSSSSDDDSGQDDDSDEDEDSDSDVKILSEGEIMAADAADLDEDDEEDPNNSGMHVNDALNVPDSTGRILVNVGHPSEDSEIFLPPHLVKVLKPHQIGGIRFLYDNIVESQARFQHSTGFGCILAHAMGLGKTIQIVSFCDLFLRHTQGKRILCIVPINTIQNWIAEFNLWLPEQGEIARQETDDSFSPRAFKLHVLNDTSKNLEQRGKIIMEWYDGGGALLMGYELYRQLANKKPSKKKKTKKQRPVGPECIDIEEEDREKSLLDDIHKALVDPGPDLVVCDEGHRIKNSHASISQALKAIRTKRRIVLTGYPLQNNLMEYWCMVDFVRPNFLGTKAEFSNMFERPILNGQCIDSTPRDVRLMMHRAHVLHTQLKGFVQRRGHKVLQKSLPPKREHVLLLRMTPIQRSLYRRFMTELVANKSVSNPLKAFAVCCKIWNHPDVLFNFLRKREGVCDDLDLDLEETSDGAQKGRVSRKNKVSERSMKTLNSQLNANLRFPVFDAPGELVNNGPGFDPFSNLGARKDEISYDWTVGIMSKYVPGLLDNSTKFPVFFKILEACIREGDRLLVFSQSLLTLNLLEDFLSERMLPGTNRRWQNGENYFRFDGSTPATERERLICAFNNAPRGVGEGGIPLFLVSTRAGSLGVNLVGANRVVVLDASWNPCHDSQAVCRVYRYGQIKTSHIYRLVTDNSIEKKIYDRQINKQGMADRVVDELNPDNHLSSKDINSLICDNEEDPPDTDLLLSGCTAEDDVILKKILMECRGCLTKAPFAHESLLIDRKDKKLTKAEKRLAERTYQMERGSKISYSRPSYRAYYSNPLPVTPPNLTNNVVPNNLSYATAPGTQFTPSNAYSKEFETHLGYMNPSSFLQSSFSNILRQQHQHFPQPQVEQRLMPSWSQPSIPPPNLPSTSGSHQKHSQAATSRFPAEALAKQGVSMQEVIAPRDLTIPTNNPHHQPVFLKKDQRVMVIRTPKGIYLRMGEKIIKIRLPPGLFDAGSKREVVTLSSSESDDEKPAPNGSLQEPLVKTGQSEI